MRTVVVVSNVFVVGLTVLVLIVAPPEIPLYYSRSWGEARVGTRWEVLLIPIVLNIAHIVTWWFVSRRFRDDIPFTRIALSFMIAQSVIAVGILIRIFFLLAL